MSRIPIRALPSFLCLLALITALATSPAVAQTDSEALLSDLGRGLALALEEPLVRDRIREGIETSPFVEDRIPLTRWLKEDAELREAVLSHAGLMNRSEMVLAALPELELYFPLNGHARMWQSTPEALVAVPVAGTVGEYVVFRSNGASRSIDARIHRPQKPMLLLGPSEIDFDDPDTARKGGRLTGPYLAARYKEQLSLQDKLPLDANRFASPIQSLDSASGSDVDTSRHTYLTYLKVTHDHDGLKGSMEIEVFGWVNGSYQECTRITNVEEDQALYLPPPPSSHKIAKAVPTGTNTVHVEVWEDDDTGCVLKSSDDAVGEVNIREDQYGTIWGTSNPGNASVRVHTLDTSCGDSVCEGDENRWNCADCASCGDGICDTQWDESNSSCSIDCFCGDGGCRGDETRTNCPTDCAVCGDGFCDPEEDCIADCGSGCEPCIICPCDSQF